MPGDATESREPLVELAEAVEAIVTECEKGPLPPLGQQEMGTLRDAGAALRAAARPSRSVRSLTIPLPDAPYEHWVYMQAGWPLTDEQWAAMLHTLDKMRPGLTEEVVSRG